MSSVRWKERSCQRIILNFMSLLEDLIPSPPSSSSSPCMLLLPLFMCLRSIRIWSIKQILPVFYDFLKYLTIQWEHPSKDVAVGCRSVSQYNQDVIKIWCFHLLTWSVKLFAQWIYLTFVNRFVTLRLKKLCHRMKLVGWCIVWHDHGRLREWSKVAKNEFLITFFFSLV